MAFAKPNVKPHATLASPPSLQAPHQVPPRLPTLSSLDPFARAAHPAPAPAPSRLPTLASLSLSPPAKTEVEQPTQQSVTPRFIHAAPIDTELHTHYAGVLSPQDFVNAIFPHADPEWNMEQARSRILPMSARNPKLLGSKVHAFLLHADSRDYPAVMRYLLAVRNEFTGQADPRKHRHRGAPREVPTVKFAKVYPLRQNLLNCEAPGARFARQRTARDLGMPLEGCDTLTDGHRWEDPAALTAAFTDLMRKHDAHKGPQQQLFIKTETAAIAMHPEPAPQQRLVAEILCDAYRAYTAQVPFTRVELILDKGSAQLMLARAVIANRRADGVTTAEMQGDPGMPMAVFQALGTREQPPVSVTFLASLSTHFLSDDFSAKGGIQAFQQTLKNLDRDLTSGKTVGVDINGPESRFTDGGMRRLTVLYALLAARKAPHPARSVLRVHVGEGDLRDAKLAAGDRARSTENIGRLVDTLAPLQRGGALEMSREEFGWLGDRVPGRHRNGKVYVQLTPTRVEVRLGHATHLTLEQALNIVRSGLPVEVNIHSNMATGTLRRIDQAPVLTLLLADALLRQENGEHAPRLRMHLSTDAGGVMHGTVQGERQHYMDILNRFFNDRSDPAHIKVRHHEMQLLDSVMHAYDDLAGSGPLRSANSLDLNDPSKPLVYKVRAQDLTKPFRQTYFESHEDTSKWPRGR